MAPSLSERRARTLRALCRDRNANRVPELPLADDGSIVARLWQTTSFQLK
jgi:hypothetical protein